MIGILVLLAAVTLRQDAQLRTGCDPDSGVIASVKAGEPAQIRFALAGSATPCYKITTSAGTGYVQATLLEGLDQFLAERNNASTALDSIKITRVEVDTVQRRAAAAVESNGRLSGAVRLIETGQPQAALASLEPVLQSGNPDPNALVLAGVAAWRGDEPAKALGYWKTALEIRPDPALKNLYDKVQRETAGDRSGRKSVGMRVTLRYEGDIVSPEIAREMLNALDSEYHRISSQLGCRAEERLTAIVQSRDAYLKTTGAAEWSGGQFDGRIRIALAPDEINVGPRTRRMFAHELVHACLSSLGSWPSWFHEGMAQKLSGDRLAGLALQRVQDRIRAGEAPRLEKLGQNWSRMSAANAELAYALSLRAADVFMEDYASIGVRNVLANPGRFGEITSSINRRLELR
jgi:hypothetical protein